jgi:hypothetical protein
MPGAWYVIEVFCLLNVVSFLWRLRLLLAHMDIFAVALMELTLVLVLAWSTYKAKRLPSRILAGVHRAERALFHRHACAVAHAVHGGRHRPAAAANILSDRRGAAMAAEGAAHALHPALGTKVR